MDSKPESIDTILRKMFRYKELTFDENVQNISSPKKHEEGETGNDDLEALTEAEIMLSKCINCFEVQPKYFYYLKSCNSRISNLAAVKVQAKHKQKCIMNYFG